MQLLDSDYDKRIQRMMADIAKEGKKKPTHKMRKASSSAILFSPRRVKAVSVAHART